MQNDNIQIKRPLKFLVILPDLKSGGAQRVSINLLNGLVDRGFCVGLVSLVEAGPLKKFLLNTVKIYIVGARSLRWSLFSLNKALKRLRPIVVFSTLGYVNIALLTLKVLFKFKSRVWIREANLPSLSLPNSRFPNLMHLACKVLYRHADLVICSSARMQNELINQFRVPLLKIRFLANPIDEVAIRKYADLKTIPHNLCRRFVAVGRLNQQKGFDRLLKMFFELGDLNSELVIIGNGPMDYLLREQVKELGIATRVIFVGFTDNPWIWLRISDVFLLSSRWEGMPNAALEALACGVPVIATPESGGIAEVITFSAPGAVQVVEIGKPYIEAMQKVRYRSKDILPPSLLPPQYRLEFVVDTFVGWLNEVE
jgi:glycosyltransferase involved in cell wall biosynthesis